MCNRLGTIPGCDRQTYRRTDSHLATVYTCYGAMHTRRAVKTDNFSMYIDIFLPIYNPRVLRLQILESRD